MVWLSEKVMYEIDVDHRLKRQSWSLFFLLVKQGEVQWIAYPMALGRRTHKNTLYILGISLHKPGSGRPISGIPETQIRLLLKPQTRTSLAYSGSTGSGLVRVRFSGFKSQPYLAVLLVSNANRFPARSIPFTFRESKRVKRLYSINNGFCLSN